MEKKWYQSKTLWTNIIAAVAMFVQNQYGYVIDPTVQVYALSVVNMALRMVTNTGIK